MSTSSLLAAGLLKPRRPKNGPNWNIALCDALVQSFDIDAARWVASTGLIFSGEFFLPDQSVVRYEAVPGDIWGHVTVKAVIRPKGYGYTVSDTKSQKSQCEATAFIAVPPIYGDTLSQSDRRYVSASLMYVSNALRSEWYHASPA